MRRGTGRGVLLTLFLLAPASPAFANVYVPSLVQFLTAPLVWSVFGVTLILTVPIILSISLIEAAVLHRWTKGHSFWRLTWKLAGLNALTSLLGYWLMPTGTEVWPGLGYAFALTVVIESIPLRLLNFGLPKPAPLRAFFLASFWMNAASYTVLAGVLAWLVCVPRLLHDDPRVLTEAKGTLIVLSSGFTAPEDEYMSLSPAARKPPSWKWRLLPELAVSEYPIEYQRATDGGVWVFASYGLVSHLRYAQGRWEQKQVVAPRFADVKRVSPDGKLVCSWDYEHNSLTVFDVATERLVFQDQGKERIGGGCFSCDGRWFAYYVDSDTNRLVDLRTGKKTSLGKGFYAQEFSPVRAELALLRGNTLAICDCLAGKRTEIKIPGVQYGGLVWSPDGKLLAYFGNVSRAAYQNWTPDLRVIRADGTGSATVYRRIPMENPGLLWVP
jgi:hypothetical protein